MVKSVCFAVPGDLATPTGGYAYDRRVIGGLRDLGWEVGIVDLGGSFPRPTPEHRAAACTMLAAIPVGTSVVIDGLALGVLPEVAEKYANSHRLFGLVHHPLAFESGLSAEAARGLRKTERRSLAAVRAVIVTSNATARLLHRDYNVPNDRISVIMPGNDPVGATPRKPHSELALLSVGAIIPRKGYDVLVAALAPLRHLPWKLTIVGDCRRDAESAARLKSSIHSLGLADRVYLAGAVSDHELAEKYASADLFVLASRFEGYGMAISEAVAYGLPVVSTTAGAIPDTLPPGTGMLVPPGDVHELSRVLKGLIEQPATRASFAAAARKAAKTLPSWRQAAEQFAEVIRAAA